MSIGVGLVCKDGIVIAADTLYEGKSRVYARKLWGVHLKKGKDNLTWALAGAGLDEHIRLVLDAIQERTRELRSFRGVKDAIDETTTDFYQKRVWTQPDITKDDWPQFLIAISQKDRQQLFTVNSSGGLAAVTESFANIGAGDAIADYLAQTFFRPEAGIVAAQFLAPYIVKQAKDFGRGCGGKTHLARIPKDRQPSYMLEDDIELHEAYFARFVAQAAKLAHAGLYPTSHSYMDAQIDKLKGVVRELRIAVHRGEPLGESLTRMFGPPKRQADPKG